MHDASRQYDRTEVVAARARVKGDDIDDSHIRKGRVAPIGSNMRRLAVDQFCAFCSTRRGGSRDAARWTIYLDD